MATLFQLVFNALIGGSVNALLGVGLQLAYATTRVLNLAHGAVVLAAGYIAYDLHRGGIPYLTAAIIATAAATVLGAAIELVVYAPMRRRKASGLILLLASFALLTIGTNLLLIRYSAATVRPPVPFLNDSLIIGGAAVTPLQVIVIGTAVALLICLGAILRWTRFGVALRAVADHATVAAVVGIPVARVQLGAFTIASAIGGLSGALLALEFNLTPELAMSYAVRGFSTAIIGGAGSISGAVVAGLLLSVFQQVGAYLIGGGWQDALTYAFVFAFLIWRPQGLFGRR